MGKVDNLFLPGIKYPITLRKGTSDILVFYKIFLNREYDDNYNNPSVIIDAGANIGLFSIFMKSKYPNAKIIAIEPDVENFKILEKNLACYTNVYLENSGLWSKDCKLVVYDKNNYGKMGLVVKEDLINGTINGISVDSIMHKYALSRIDLFKLDIETSEKEVFTAGYEKWLIKTKLIVIELHDWLGVECSKPFFSAINNAFTKYAYIIHGENTLIYNQSILKDNE